MILTRRESSEFPLNENIMAAVPRITGVVTNRQIGTVKLSDIHQDPRALPFSDTIVE